MSGITQITQVYAIPKIEGDDPTSQPVTIVMDDGTEWNTDAKLPPDQWLRAELVVWLAAGGTIQNPRQG